MSSRVGTSTDHGLEEASLLAEMVEGGRDEPGRRIDDDRITRRDPDRLAAERLEQRVILVVGQNAFGSAGFSDRSGPRLVVGTRFSAPGFIPGLRAFPRSLKTCALSASPST